MKITVKIEAKLIRRLREDIADLVFNAGLDEKSIIGIISPDIAEFDSELVEVTYNYIKYLIYLKGKGKDDTGAFEKFLKKLEKLEDHLDKNKEKQKGKKKETYNKEMLDERNKEREKIEELYQALHETKPVDLDEYYKADQKKDEIEDETLINKMKVEDLNTELELENNYQGYLDSQTDPTMDLNEANNNESKEELNQKITDLKKNISILSDQVIYLQSTINELKEKLATQSEPDLTEHVAIAVEDDTILEPLNDPDDILNRLETMNENVEFDSYDDEELGPTNSDQSDNSDDEAEIMNDVEQEDFIRDNGEFDSYDDEELGPTNNDQSDNSDDEAEIMNDVEQEDFIRDNEQQDSENKNTTPIAEIEIIDEDNQGIDVIDEVLEISDDSEVLVDGEPIVDEADVTSDDAEFDNLETNDVDDQAAENKLLEQSQGANSYESLDDQNPGTDNIATTHEFDDFSNDSQPSDDNLEDELILVVVDNPVEDETSNSDSEEEQTSTESTNDNQIETDQITLEDHVETTNAVQQLDNSDDANAPTIEPHDEEKEDQKAEATPTEPTDDNQKAYLDESPTADLDNEGNLAPSDNTTETNNNDQTQNQTESTSDDQITNDAGESEILNEVQQEDFTRDNEHTNSTIENGESTTQNTIEQQPTTNSADEVKQEDYTLENPVDEDDEEKAEPLPSPTGNQETAQTGEENKTQPEDDKEFFETMSIKDNNDQTNTNNLENDIDEIIDPTIDLSGDPTQNTTESTTTSDENPNAKFKIIKIEEIEIGEEVIYNDKHYLIIGAEIHDNEVVLQLEDTNNNEVIKVKAKEVQEIK